MITVNFSETSEALPLTKPKETLQAKETPSAAVSQVAREFESLLLTQITSSLRAKSDEGDDQNSDNSSLDLSQQIVAEQMAQVIAKNGGVGLVDVLVQQLERQKQNLTTKEKPLENVANTNINNDAEGNITRPRRVFDLHLHNKENVAAKLISKIHSNKLAVKPTNSTNKATLSNQVNSGKQLDDIILEASNRHGVDPYLVAAVVEQESSGKQFAVSKRGAAGYMQLMPGTFQQFGGSGKNIFDAHDNINAGVAYIKFLSEKYDGNIDKILAGYNAGPANVNKYGGIPPFAETHRFVGAVKDRQNQMIAKNELTSLVAKNVKQQNNSAELVNTNTSNRNQTTTVQNAVLKTTSVRLVDEVPSNEKKTLQIPVEGRISSKFGAARTHRTHKGIDIAVKRGTTIEAAAEGEVIFSGWQKGYGKTLLIQHKDGRLTRYAHAENLLVSKGEKVSSGQKVATVGSTGRSTGPHLHFEVIEDGKAINPLLVAKTKTSIPNNVEASILKANTTNNKEEKPLTLATFLPIIQ